MGHPDFRCHAKLLEGPLVIKLRQNLLGDRPVCFGALAVGTRQQQEPAPPLWYCLHLPRQ